MKAARVGIAIMIACAASACSSPEAWVDPLPRRPADLVVAGSDPCALVTAQQAATVGIEDAGKGYADAGSPGCDWRSGDGDARYSIQIFPVTGARAFVPGNPQQQGRDILENPTLTTIDGYGAVVSGLLRGGSTDCSVIVDTSPDSSFRVVRSDLNRSDRNTNCGKASEFAGFVLSTLTG